MEQHIGSLIGRYRQKGVLVDTNLLLLYVVGAYDARQLRRFGRTEQFDPDDFAVLYAFLQRFDLVVTTPHVLTETSNLVGQLSGHVRTGCFALLKRVISLMREHRAPATTVVADPGFVPFGITDAAIAEASPGTYLVLTDDLPLYGYLGSRGVDVLNFNNIRPFTY